MLTPRLLLTEPVAHQKRCSLFSSEREIGGPAKQLQSTAFGRLGIQRLPAAGGLVHHIGLRQDLRLHAVHAAAAP